MLTAERRNAILGRLERDGKVVASDLVAALGVSEDTVRRDLKELAAQGRVQRVHGGALPAASVDASFSQRLEIGAEAKARVAEAALPLLEGARVVLLDGGTTALELARRLPDRPLTAITNSPPVAAALARHSRADVILVGGRLLKPSQVTVGAAAVDAIRAVRADVAVLGICSLHPDVGVTALDHEESLVKRAVVESAAEVIALATADKLRSAAPYLVASLADLDHVVTDAGEELTRPYAAAGLDVVRA